MEIQCKSCLVQMEFLSCSSEVLVVCANHFTVSVLSPSVDCSWLLMDPIRSSPHYESTMSIF
jgi:hypothetical protein